LNRESGPIACYTTRMSEEDQSPLKFPCQFPIKAMGKSDCQLDIIVVEIIRKHVPDLSEGAVYNRNSSGGNYTSVTVVVNATSRAQLDAIYQDLVDCEAVIMAL